MITVNRDKVIDWGADNPHDYDHFLGFGKKAKAKKADRQAFKKDKRSIKLDMKRARVGNLQSKAESRKILAEQGIVQPTDVAGFGQALGSALQGASSLMGGGGAGGGLSSLLGGASGNSDPGTISPPLIAPTGDTLGAQQQAVQQQIDATRTMYQQDQASGQGAATDDAGDPNDPNSPAAKKKKQTNTYLLIGGAVVLVVIVAVLFLKGKKK